MVADPPDDRVATPEGLSPVGVGFRDPNAPRQSSVPALKRKKTSPRLPPALSSLIYLGGRTRVTHYGVTQYG